MEDVKITKMTIECAEGGFICFDDYEELAQRFSLDEKGTIYFTSWKHREIVRRFRKKISAEFAREILDIAAEVFPKEFEKCPDPYVICDAIPDEILLKKSDGTYQKGWVHGGDTVEKFYYLLHHYVDIDNLFLRDWSDDPIELEWDQPQTIKAFAEKWIRIFSEGKVDKIIDGSFLGDCAHLNFVMDGGESFCVKYGQESGRTEVLKTLIKDVDDVQLLGSAVYSRYRFFTHWEEDPASMAKKEHREWFLLCLKRMKQLAKMPPEMYVD